MYRGAITANSKLLSPVLFKMDVCVHFLVITEKSIITDILLTLSNFATMAAFSLAPNKSDFFCSHLTQIVICCTRVNTKIRFFASDLGHFQMWILIGYRSNIWTSDLHLNTHSHHNARATCLPTKTAFYAVYVLAFY